MRGNKRYMPRDSIENMLTSTQAALWFESRPRPKARQMRESNVPCRQRQDQEDLITGDTNARYIAGHISGPMDERCLVDTPDHFKS